MLLPVAQNRISQHIQHPSKPALLVEFAISNQVLVETQSPNLQFGNVELLVGEGVGEAIQ